MTEYRLPRFDNQELPITVREELLETCPAAFPPDFDWRPLTGKGTLTKRLNRYAQQNGADTSSKEFRSFLCAVGEKVSDLSSDYKVRFSVTDLSTKWSEGSYNDAHSCFWHSRAYDWDFLKAIGALAVLIHDNPARCFAIPAGPITGIPKGWVIINNYGAGLLFFARLLSSFFGMDYRIVLQERESPFFINTRKSIHLWHGAKPAMKVWDFPETSVDLRACRQCLKLADAANLVLEDNYYHCAGCN
ncbi:MAG: hypothetical protein HC888_06810 [Candidatus Competibacteraceae bacterium]|nr:hypothetical protein [Candidatus Competibacteraceae bacterium]